MSIINKIIAPFSPKTARDREIAHSQYKIVASQTGTESRQETRWRGASNVLRSLKSWFSVTGSARADLPESEPMRFRGDYGNDLACFQCGHDQCNHV